ncbi:MAG: GNAT family N-acetyltransferase [Anaerolineae bacterium]|nr:GNAT family N-acetyltransferase [Anaerolineae bacterium]
MPRIETARLVLRPFVLEDADAYYHAVMCDPDVRRFLPGGQSLPRERAVPIMEHFIAQWAMYGFGGMAVLHKSDAQLIGQCGLQFIPDTDKIEVFYALAKVYWGQGLAPEAARACLHFGFEERGFDQINALFMPGNTGSERVMIKLGMTHQGLLYAYDTELPWYAIVRAAFEPGNTPYIYHAEG